MLPLGMSSRRRRANPRPRWLVVVARDQDEVHHKLSAALSDDCLVWVIFDRRRDPGRNPEWVSRSLPGGADLPLCHCLGSARSRSWRARGSLNTRTPLTLCLLAQVGVPVYRTRFPGHACRMSRGTARTTIEPHLVSRRLHTLRGWGHGETKQVFPGGAGARGADGVRARPGTRVASRLPDAAPRAPVSSLWRDPAVRRPSHFSAGEPLRDVRALVSSRSVGDGDRHRGSDDWMKRGIELSTEEDREECRAGWSYPPGATPSTELFRSPA